MNLNITSAVQATSLSHAARVRHRTEGWVTANTTFARSEHPEFARLLRQSAYPVQKLYRQLMQAYDGEPVGVECRCSSRQHWAFVVPETGVPGKFRIQYFDEDGFTGHCVYPKLEEAVETMLREDYRVVDVGALDRTAATPRWARGVKVAALRQRAQEGLMTFQEMLEAINALG